MEPNAMTVEETGILESVGISAIKLDMLPKEVYIKSGAEPVLTMIDKIFQENPEYAADPKLFHSVLAVRFPYFGEGSENYIPMNNRPVMLGSLVRFRGMVQDFRDTEFIAASYGFRNSTDEPFRLMSGLMRDEYPSELNCEDENLKSVPPPAVGRDVYTVVEIPGESEWYARDYSNHCAVTGQTIVVQEEKIPDDDGPSQKRSCTEKKVYTKLMAKIANFVQPEELKNTSVYDFYGYLSAPVVPADINATTSLEIEELACNPNLPGVPSLHVIHHVAVASSAKYRKFTDAQKEDMVTTAEMLRKRLAELMGDDVSAEHLLMHLISTTYARIDGIPLCSVPLNIVGVDDDTKRDKIIGLVKTLMPMVKVLEITPETLCNVRMPPTKLLDGTEELQQGELQLSAGTILIMDETKFDGAKKTVVNQLAEKNLEYIGYLLKDQIMSYDFHFSRCVVEADIPILVLSKGDSFFFRTPFRVPFMPTPQNDAWTNDSLGIEIELQLFRIFIQNCRGMVKFVTAEESYSQFIQTRFIQLLKEVKKDASFDRAEFLSHLLIIARLQSIVYSEAGLLPANFERSVDLMKARTRLLTKWSEMKEKKKEVVVNKNV